MDSYQAIYDAVRSRIQQANIGDIVREAAHQGLDFSYDKIAIREAFVCAAYELQRPCVVFKAKIMGAGESWTASCGDVVGTGKSPADACIDFDRIWNGRPK